MSVGVAQAGLQHGRGKKSCGKPLSMMLGIVAAVISVATGWSLGFLNVSSSIGGKARQGLRAETTSASSDPGYFVGEKTAGTAGIPTPLVAATAAAAVGMAVSASSRLRQKSVLVALRADAADEQAPPKPPKIRISAFDSIRFFLIAYIVCGHFVSFANPSPFALKAVTQINVVVGAFFALSGYVAAYTSTEVGERAASAKLIGTPAAKWVLQRIFGFYPLHLFILVLFSPMFAYSDFFFGGWPTAIWHGFLSLTMAQAWFPMHAEIWNAPTWFLSALTFATCLLPFSLKVLAKQNKRHLRRSALFLFLVGLLPRLGYCYDHNAWSLMEGAMNPKAMANLAIFNTQRFNPFYAAIEVLQGAVACRLVMMDGAEGETRPKKSDGLGTVIPLAAMIAVILLRAVGHIDLSDLMVRSCIFIPLFLTFLMATHRASIQPTISDPIVQLLQTKRAIRLGNLAFPIFVIHGPIGQLCYKKVIATKLFGAPLNVLYGPNFFWGYLTIVMALAWVLQKTFLTNKSVTNFSKSAVETLSSAC
eukprot:TRINITY_DN3571_c0_g1_i1.p1 TRINITY_DN3571_c0_g1~~TRINITY_DN3571_c0_g1_i1.p1  ORF type:complete len:533 (-),score=99.17 TRINITY_DN3571_c0_g1_i1:372-1970(-)